MHAVLRKCLLVSATTAILLAHMNEAKNDDVAEVAGEDTCTTPSKANPSQGISHLQATSKNGAMVVMVDNTTGKCDCDSMLLQSGRDSVSGPGDPDNYRRCESWCIVARAASCACPVCGWPACATCNFCDGSEPPIEEPDCTKMELNQPVNPTKFPSCYKCGNIEPPIPSPRGIKKIPGCYDNLKAATYTCTAMCKAGGQSPDYLLRAGQSCKAIQLQAKSPQANNQFADYTCTGGKIFYQCELFTKFDDEAVKDYPAQSGTYYYANRECVDDMNQALAL